MKHLARLRAEVEGTGLSLREAFDFGLMLTLLAAFWYWGRPSWYVGTLGVFVQPWVGFTPLHPYAWWAITSLVLRIGVPALVIIFVYRQSLRDYGWRLTAASEAWKVYVLLYVMVAPIVFAASFLPSFQSTYPFADVARISPSVMVWYEIFYGIQFLGVEAFFRGWMLFALARWLGNHAIFVMTVPYMMIHLPKPPLEAFAAIFAGVVLGWLALRTRTFLHGAALHWAVAITMDACAIWQKGGFLS